MVQKLARIPVAKHGLHNHKYNFPYLGTFNFMEVTPVYSNFLRIGESDHPRFSLFSRLNALTNPAFVTGRYNYKAFFVPFKYIFRPWYSFDTGTEFTKANGTSTIYNNAPFTSMGQLTSEFIDSHFSLSGSSSSYDFVYNNTYYKFTEAGRRVFKILNSLGYSPTWDTKDNTLVNVLPLLSFIKIFQHYFFPNNYVNDSNYLYLENAITLEDSNYNTHTKTYHLLVALELCSYAFYDNSIFDMCFDNPVGTNVPNNQPTISMGDPTVAHGSVIDADPSVELGTPHVSLTQGGVLTKFINDGLNTITNYLKRLQLAGGRLMNRLLVERGEKPNHDSVGMPYFLGEYNVEINVDAVENNSDTNLGELAGKGIASTGDKPFDFDCEAMDDGMFMVVQTVMPDCEMPVFNDGFNFAVSQLEFFHPDFDKQGVVPVPSSCVYQGMNGDISITNFGFLNRYWHRLQERTRLVGDFRLASRGSVSLSSFYPFRIYYEGLVPATGIQHSYEFVSSKDDSLQYQRFFYSSEQDNLQVYLRIIGNQRLEKLPLGESYDWDDDEFNKRVSVVVNGSQK